MTGKEVIKNLSESQRQTLNGLLMLSRKLDQDAFLKVGAKKYRVVRVTPSATGQYPGQLDVIKSRIKSLNK